MEIYGGPLPEFSVSVKILLGVGSQSPKKNGIDVCWLEIYSFVSNSAGKLLSL